MDDMTLLEEIQAIARTGLHYSENGYDRERYERLLTLALNSYQELLDLPDEKIRTRFAAEIGSITPKIGADAAIFNDEGEILLQERVDGSGWCLPCGWVEVNERPVDAAVREVREETGLKVVAKQLVGVFSRPAGGRYSPHSMIAIVHLCDVVGGELTLSHEGLALKYWPINEVEKWHATHETYARAAYKMWRSNQLLPAISD